jgi:hypothetical protein
MRHEITPLGWMVMGGAFTFSVFAIWVCRWLARKDRWE